MKTFCYGDVLFQRRFVTGDVLLRRCSDKESFCREYVLCGDVLYVRQILLAHYVVKWRCTL
jgi:hypothetical protein